VQLDLPFRQSICPGNADKFGDAGCNGSGEDDLASDSGPLFVRSAVKITEVQGMPSLQ
jgi:hypothetical protein